MRSHRQLNATKTPVQAGVLLLNQHTMQEFMYTKEDGMKEAVKLEPFRWLARERGTGRHIEQFAADGVFHRIGEAAAIDCDRISLVDEGARAVVTLDVPEGAKVVHKYKHYILNADTKAELRRKVYCIGWVNGNVRQMAFVRQDGAILVTDGRDDLHGMGFIT